MEMTKGAENQLDAWNQAARIALVAGAVGSVAFTLYAGRHQRSAALLVLFVLWVLLPFAGLYATERASRAAPAKARVSLQIATVILSACSLTSYGFVALGAPRHNTAFIFIVFPGVSWLVIGADFLIAWRMSRQAQ